MSLSSNDNDEKVTNKELQTKDASVPEEKEDLQPASFLSMFQYVSPHLSTILPSLFL